MKGFIYTTEQDAIDKRDLVNTNEGYPKNLSNGLVLNMYCDVLTHPDEDKWAIIADPTTRKHISDTESDLLNDWFNVFDGPDISELLS